MKICFAIQKISGISGGAEKVLVDVANYFSKSGHQVHIVCYENYGEPPFYPIEPNILFMNIKPFDARRRDRQLRFRIRDNDDLQRKKAALSERIGSIPFLASMQWDRENKLFIQRLSDYFDWHRPDVVVAFLPGIAPQVIEARKISRHKPKVMFSLHNSPWADFEDATKWSSNRKDIKLRRRAVVESDMTTALLPSYLDFFSTSERSNIEVQPNYIPSDQGVEYEARENVFLSVGRLTPTKNHRQMIEAFASVHDQMPGWRIEIFGKGPLETELQELILDLGLESSIFLMGHTSELSRFYAKSAVFILPSWNEGFPLVLGEAFSYRLPAIGFADCTGVNQLIRNGENGVLVENRNTEDLADVMVKVVKDVEFRNSLSRGALDLVSAGEYAYAEVMAIWEEKIRRLMIAR